ncbi:hypothetical protein PIB30_088919 [Stylosanthes scabra]|uniref:Uncharacterized protein n=1 Tax=Stylosanthes scabra TaxID=79078 RepID=A0ABU6TTF0_9FABA|nr:hypothetical protein [Stylosanthes scabra]
MIGPCNGFMMWEQTPYPDVMSPIYRVPIGRPTKKRKRAEGEEPQGPISSRVGLAQKCSHCLQLGHNKRGCPRRILRPKHPFWTQTTASAFGSETRRTPRRQTASLKTPTAKAQPKNTTTVAPPKQGGFRVLNREQQQVDKPQVNQAKQAKFQVLPWAHRSN